MNEPRNSASKIRIGLNFVGAAGFTPQYKELGELYDRYSGQGFVILGTLLLLICRMAYTGFTQI